MNVFIYNSIMKSYSQTRKFGPNQSNFMFIITLFLVVFPFFIIKSISHAILYFFLLVTTIGLSLFFWASFVPFFPKGFSGFSQTSQTLFLSIFRNTNSSLHIQAGKFDGDYFFIQNKPKLDALLIDEKSAVIVANNAGTKRVILPGYQFIKNGEKALHTFNIGFHHFFWGPRVTENLFRKKTLNLDLSQAHLHSLRVAQTKCQTKDEITVVPSFSIFYDFSSLAEKTCLRDMLLDISSYFSANKIYGELQLEMNKLIGGYVTNICKDLLANTNVEQLTSPTDQNSSFTNDLLIKINALINTKFDGITPNSHKKKEHYHLESIKPLSQWKLLNIRVFLNNFWIQKDAP